MRSSSILSENQKRLLGLLSREQSISAHFYLTGGTALSEFYLHHRLSEDLDFFSEGEFEPQSISVVLKKIQKAAGIEKIEYQQSFNRNLFFLHTDTDVIKTEFTYFPFPRIEQARKIGNLPVDSLVDIAVNKLFTIYQKPRSRDFIDLYMILAHDSEWTLKSLIEKTQIKFDTYIDPVQLGGQYMRVTDVKDYPRMVETLDGRLWQEFFVTAAKKLSPKVFT